MTRSQNHNFAVLFTNTVGSVPWCLHDVTSYARKQKN